MSDKEKTRQNIVFDSMKEVWDRIVSGDKTIEYRDCGEYWDKRIKDKQYRFMKIQMVMEMPQDPIVYMKYQGYEIVKRDEGKNTTQYQ